MVSEGGARIVPLERAVCRGEVGGKAAGLSRLIGLQLGVPPGFVVVGARPGGLPADLEGAFRRLGGPVAVRSSASDEDGGQASFAGQYSTVLDVADGAALASAVERCLASLQGARARAYRGGGGDGDGRAMSVVVQRMVDARVSGVLFTVDPVSARRDRLVVDAVPGPGEALVSGHAEPDHFVISRDGAVQSERPANDGQLLSAEELARLSREALIAEADAGTPLDLEWAIDRQGRLFWLQARPVTALGSDPREFDTPAPQDRWYTWANIGEMLPGAVCPLDLSTVVPGIDRAIQHMFVACGVQPSIDTALQVVGVFDGHLFFNLSSVLPFCRQVGGSSPQTLMYAICGRVVPGFAEGERPDPAPGRALRGLRNLRYMLGGEGEVRRMERKLRGFDVPGGADPRQSYREIDRRLPLLLEIYRVHIQSSSGSGLTSGVLQGLLAHGEIPTAEQEAELARLLAGARGVESADLVAELDRLAGRLAASCPDFPEITAEQALTWLRSKAAGSAGALFARFLERHGHRALRELSLQQPGWSDDPLPLVTALQACARGRVGPRRDGGAGARSLPLHMRWLLAWSRRTVRRRERSKSLLVWVTDRFKRAYRGLAAQLVQGGELPEAELLYFLTHPELGQLVEGRRPDLVRLALARRQTFRRQQGLRYPTVSTGRPEPLDDAPPQGAGGALEGQPVSPGVVEGVARVVLEVSEAAALQPGEILIAPVTDVGWSPYFRLIGGLATDVGSAISHGAVVAREYGLPAVVNLHAASRLFRTGDRVRLDADRGTLTRLTDPEGHA